jgi:hypothetical protein
LRGRPRPTRTEDLAVLPLPEDGGREDWALWFQAYGVHPVLKKEEALAGPSLDDQMLLM